MPVITVTQEAEVEDRLGLGGRDCSELWWCYCITAWMTEQDLEKRLVNCGTS